MKTYSITTFGCQMNLSDSERVAAVCRLMGYKECPEGEIADLYVINTCSVRQKAEDRVLGMGKKFAKLKTRNPKLKIVLTGCMAKRDIRQGFEKSNEYQKKYEGKLQKQMPWLDYVLEINDIHKLPEILKEKVEEKVEDYFAIKPTYNSTFQAFVPISTGCNKFCTFCIVPFTRGKEVYRPFEQIYKEVKDLVDSGFKEITLLGQNVNSWSEDNSLRSPITPLRKQLTVNKEQRTENNEIPNSKSKIPEEESEVMSRGSLLKGTPEEGGVSKGREGSRDLTLDTRNSSAYIPLPPLEGGIPSGTAEQHVNTLTREYATLNSQFITPSLDFAGLIEHLASIESDFWLRFTSSHPYDINMELIDVIAEKENIAKQIHFALQSGSNSVLKRMNRYYTREDFKEKVLKIKGKVPGIAITTDVIVGFCGETEEEFTDTLKLCEELNSDQIFISEYSQREGTIASKFYKDDIPAEIKAARKVALDEVLKKGVAENNQKLVGTEQKVLIYRTKSKNREGVFGRTTHGKDVLIEIPNSTAQIPEGKELRLGQFVTVKITGFKGFCLEGEVLE